MVNPYERFKDYKPGSGKKISFKEASWRQNIESIWNCYYEFADEKDRGAADVAATILSKKTYTAAYVRDFSREYANSEKVDPLDGYFLTALANQVPEQIVKLYLGEVGGKIDYIGAGLNTGKELIIEGDVGNMAGIGLDGAVLRIKGDARDKLGENMIGGKIYVAGNVGKELASNMLGGLIEIKGNVQEFGKKHGGIVYVEGEILELKVETGKMDKAFKKFREKMLGGQVYEKGILLIQYSP
jgi:formylmethanofuran dehydrogenase subunit C